MALIDKFLDKKDSYNQFPELYSRNSDGSVQTWKVEVEGNKYRFHSGRQNGKIVISEWTVCKGKNIGKQNETSPQKQALKEAKASMRKKLKKDYWEDINDIDKRRFFQPMLAKKYKNHVKQTDLTGGKWLLQIKYNGMRAIATKEGIFSRTGERVVTVPHIEESLKPFFDKNPEAVLDGELYNYDLRQMLNELIKLCRKTVHITHDDLDKSKEMVRYYIYDGCILKDPKLNESAPYYRRKEWIDEKVIKLYKYCELVKSYPIYSKNQLDDLYKGFIQDNEEGGILRKSDGEYENKRTRFLLKLKEDEDSEGEIVYILEGTGNWSGTGKVIGLKWRGKTFEATFKGTYHQGVEFLRKQLEWIGKKVTFKYNGLTGKGVPNYARVDINNCLKEKR